MHAHVLSFFCLTASTLELQTFQSHAFDRVVISVNQMICSEDLQCGGGALQHTHSSVRQLLQRKFATRTRLALPIQDTAISDSSSPLKRMSRVAAGDDSGIAQNYALYIHIDIQYGVQIQGNIYGHKQALVWLVIRLLSWRQCVFSIRTRNCDCRLQVCRCGDRSWEKRIAQISENSKSVLGWGTSNLQNTYCTIS